MLPATLPPSRCEVCGARLPVGTPAGLCPFCVPEEDAADGSTVRLLGDYELLDEIGRGGMGVVWRARQRTLRRFVAVKTLPGGDLASAEARARFRNEALVTARLKHPNLVTVHEVGDADGVPFLVMELVEGRPLNEVLAGPPLAPKLAARWLHDVALAVQHAHENGVLHRDLKPSNILIESGDDGGRPRVTDFGLAKLADVESSFTRTGSAVGSPAYMPPEQARYGEYTVRSDVYGLGAILYTVLTGRPPFQGESVATVLAQVDSDEPIAPRRLNAGIPIGLETICLKCLEKNPSRRYDSARVFAEDVTRFLRGELVQARPVGPMGRLVRSASRHPWRAMVVVLAAAMFLGAGITLERNARIERQHSAALKKEQAATQLALMKAQLGEARAIIRLRQADSRPRAEAIVQQVIDQQPPAELRGEVRDVALAALALPVARYERLLGDGVVSDDWTLACGDLPRDRWALALFRGPVVLRAVNAASNTLSFGVGARQVTALIGFSPGGRWLAIRHRDEMGIWDTSLNATQRLAFVARPWTRGRSFNFTKLAFAPDDRAVLWVDGGSVVATSLPEGAELGSWSGAVESVAFDPSGKFFALARANEAAVELRSWPDGALLRVFSGNFPQPLCALALTSGAERIAGGDRAGRVTAWRGDGRQGSLIELRGHAEMIRGINFSKDGRLIAATSEEGTLRVWESSGGDELAKLNFDAAALSFSSDGNRVGVGYGSGRLAQVRLEHSPVLHTFRPDPAPETPQAVSFLPDGTAVSCLGLSQAFVCSVPHGRVLSELPFPRPYTVLAESAAGGGLLVSGAEGVWRYPLRGDGARVELLPSARWGWDSLTLSGNGRWIAASDNGGSRVAVWPMGSVDPSQVKFVSMGSLGPGTIALSPDGTRLAVGYRYDPGLLIMDVASGESKQRLDLPARHALGWSPDGRWLAACGTTAPMWDTTSWRPVALPELEPNHPPAGDVTFSPPEGGVCRWMAVVAGGSRVVLIDIESRQIAAVFEAPSRRSIYRLGFSPDRRWLAAACARGEIQLWDLAVANRRMTRNEVAGR